jgi:hypothetical protein
MKCECYKVLYAPSTEVLEQEVHKAVCNGMVPLGGVVCVVCPLSARISWAQSMAAPAVLLNVATFNRLEALFTKLNRKWATTGYPRASR